MSNDVSRQILEEMLDPSVRVVEYIERAQAERSVANQLTRSITSIGANYSEAQDAVPPRDFVNKIYIAKKEASESVYRLRFIEKLRSKTDVLAEFEAATQHFVVILQKIINSTRAKSLPVKG